MGRNPEATRRELLDAAARLFAERGIAAVSLNEINTAAGQRNASALQYHFRSREGLLRALLERHIPQVRARRDELLAAADADPEKVRRAAEAFVLPLAELLEDGWRGRAFLRIVAELMADPSRSAPEVRQLLDATAADEAYARIWKHGRGVPALLRPERMRVGGTMVLHALADRARLLEHEGRPTQIAPELFTGNLVDMFLGATLAPVAR
ncbi:TetR/AcrR family transcriptional regulator [Yinghuangia seranimata]|uniref:TetR/AcrR family transcriptional regulator n=1 Tax=Yinghuangia seranimata TaxID=408067 RepID=UPI00248BADFD|nr:helix-turn-helix domain-containing protein [Yinghuangia seranimata]MDI2125177.1 helix-turn-helix domain-containing protein [Yinghuangia seranimata]